jgi:anti-sigma regulatory factor (Ser/Thr protein kinase)
VERRFPDPLPEDFATVTDELTSNAIKAMVQCTEEGTIFYPYGSHFTVSFELFAQFPCVRVWDACPVIPDPTAEPELDEFAETGRGLAIVRALAAAFTYIPTDPGKIAIAVMSG